MGSLIQLLLLLLIQTSSSQATSDHSFDGLAADSPSILPDCSSHFHYAITPVTKRFVFNILTLCMNLIL